MGGGEVLAMLKGGHEKFWGSFCAELEDLAILIGGGGAQKVSTL